MYLKGRTALITGSAKRIGRGIALGLAKEGVNIVLHYNTSEESALRLKDEIEEIGVKCWLVKGELSKDYAKILDNAFKLTEGNLDFLINNASIFPASKVTMENLNSIVTVNSWVPLLLSLDFSRKLSKGKIVNILDSIISGYNFERYPYFLSKKLLEIITVSLALKLSPSFQVNGVAPGLILPPEGKDNSYLENLKSFVPMKRYGNVEEVVNAVIFLLKSDFITGQIIYVDGGEHLTPRVVL
ncbi:SDR family NAD(P)-dependent oxidoreductase [Sulfolobus acidocaldarius]|uniref:Dehydrogenase n=4 Tax=Sulfolobus acidocaldarius TaxID=2285 RepID=Q4J9S6_SULAC|nr:SDR family NAD(P)-dependent oxidoreductase [Sulfolobus acidocaldarius]AAY80454.1 dehydrogenase [Sulfolobus acidocaldarius DSM 639]AGE71039.1 dehydrogenase [Sulfolobus acidocaldarius N8]AGE73310.1 dehydrogenase [Sulfolobus acidocaldarius Ron12/I]ALU28670.1 dehydrogenase [Sulfolobus acidocaldarius]ALU31386.1 dehydrogenase [Sulfolobus acidocaldarius]